METPILTRRAFVGGLVALVATPAIVRASSIMSIKVLEPEFLWLTDEALTDFHPSIMERLKSFMVGKAVLWRKRH